MEKVDCVIIGAGVIGLAIAREISARGMETIILERASAFGTETSSRNSEVIHAGIYYAPGSLKSRLSVKGRAMLYEYASDRGIPHRRCGKLIVATNPEQEAELATIAEKARACGVADLVLLSGAEAIAMEPSLACYAALLSPSTGIIDSHALMSALLADAETNGAILSLNTEVTGGSVSGPDFLVETRDTVSGASYALATRYLVNAGGIYASRIARSLSGMPENRVPETFFARGNYFAVPGKPAFSRLIYPVPEPGGLGVHLTLDLGGNMRFGPDVEWIDEIDYRTSNARRGHFEDEIRKYWPGLQASSLSATYCGIRPKLSRPGEPAADFVIAGPESHGVPGLVQLFGIESPGLTSSLAIAQEAAQRLLPARP